MEKESLLFMKIYVLICKWCVNCDLQKTAQVKLEQHVYGNADGKDCYKKF